MLILHADATFLQRFGGIAHTGRREYSRGSVVLDEQHVFIGTPTFPVGQMVVAELSVKQTTHGPALIYDENLGRTYVRLR